MTTPIDIYNAYPKKVGKPVALRAIKRAIQVSGDDADTLLERTKEYADHVEKRGVDRQYLPHPSTFYNQWRWQDDYEDLHPKPQPKPWETEQPERKFNFL